MPKKYWAFLVVFILVIPIVLADVTMSVTDTFVTVGKWLSEIFQNDYATFGITLIVLTILLRAIYAAGLKRVKIFEGAGGEGLNSFGNTITWTVAIMSSISLYYLKANRDMGAFLRQVLGPAAVYAGIAAVVLMFWWIKSSVGTKWSIPLTGLAAIMISNMVQWPILATLGVFMIIIGFFWVAGSLARPRSSGASYRDLRREEDESSRMGQTYNRDQQTDNSLANSDRQEQQMQSQVSDLEAREKGYDSMIDQNLTYLATPGAAHNLIQLFQREKSEISYEITKRKTANDLNKKESKTAKKELEINAKETHKFKEYVENLKFDNPALAVDQERQRKELLNIIGISQDLLRSLIKNTDEMQTIGKQAIIVDEKRLQIIDKQIKALVNMSGKQVSENQKELLMFQREKEKLDAEIKVLQKCVNDCLELNRGILTRHKDLLAEIPKKIQELKATMKSEEVSAASGAGVVT